jgi:outer membrane immunogenic protein
MPTKAPAFNYNWTGFYIGANAGYSFGGSTWTDSISGLSSGNIPISGFAFGGTIGANIQAGSFVFGVEGDGAWTDPSGQGTFTGSTLCAGGCTTTNNWLATARGRVGYAFDRYLVYATGGAAFGDIQGNFSLHPISSSTETGWTAGAGVEVAIVSNWTAKAEYLYVELPNGSCTTDCANTQNPNIAPVVPNIAIKFNESLVRLGVNYKFGW